VKAAERHVREAPPRDWRTSSRHPALKDVYGATATHDAGDLPALRRSVARSGSLRGRPHLRRYLRHLHLAR